MLPCLTTLISVLMFILKGEGPKLAQDKMRDWADRDGRMFLRYKFCVNP